jgi:hypothetical protein
MHLPIPHAPSTYRFLWLCGLFALLLLRPATAQAGIEQQGLQGGWAVDDLGNLNFTSSLSLHTPTLHEAEAGWLRINFRLGRCFTDWTTVGCNGRTAVQVYGEVIAHAQEHGFRVLALLSNEARHGSQNDWTARNAEVQGGAGDNAYIQGFGHDAGILARSFAQQIDHWELWNEPDAWTQVDERGAPAGGSFVYPSNFAWLLRRARDEIKLAQPDAVIISGGLFAHDLDGPRPMLWPGRCPTTLVSGADYLCATYEMGLQHAGWTRPYPLDHIGQHLYLDQGGPTSERKLRGYLRDLHQAYQSLEGPDTRKQIYITEVGWTTAFVSPEVQASNVVLAYDTFRRTPYVARSFWFTARDVPEGNLFFGLADASGRKKPSFLAYQRAAGFDSPGDSGTGGPL